MKVLWLTQVKIPRIDLIEGNSNITVTGGWLTGLSDTMLQSDLVEELTIIYPSFDGMPHEGKEGKFCYYGMPVNSAQFYDGRLDISTYKEIMKKYLARNTPDVIHIHGTEFQLSYALALACKELGLINCTGVSIQGLVSVYAAHYFAGIPERIVKKRTLWEIKSRNSLIDNLKRYKSRGTYEVKTLQLVPNIIGRTRWDKGCSEFIAPDSKYYFCNETLRSEFYSGSWDYNKCNKHTIFLSQGSKPIKGVHKVLEAIRYIKDRYPNIKVKIGGRNMFSAKSLIQDTYARYIHKLVKGYKLEGIIEFTGFLNASEMKEHLLMTNVFVSPSSIENSPNSLGEAMLLGVPCIVSDVGGVPDLLEDRKEGFIYPFDESYMLAYYISEVFENPEKAKGLGLHAQVHARKTHDPDDNFKQLIKIYSELIGRG